MSSPAKIPVYFCHRKVIKNIISDIGKLNDLFYSNTIFLQYMKDILY